MTIKLKSGVSVHGDKLRVNISYRGARYRLSTIYPATQANVPKAYALAQSIKLDLTRGLFYLVNYKNKIPNIEILADYDIDYQKTINKKYISELLHEQRQRHLTAYENKQLKYGTIRNYEYVVDKHLLPAFGDYEITEVTVHHLEAFIASLKLSKSRINVIMSPLREIFRREKKRGTVSINPVEQLNQNEIRLNSIDSDYEISPFNSTEKELIISSAEGQLRNIIQLSFWSGMRIGELIAITWQDIDLDGCVIFVSKSKTWGRIGAPKTKAGYREVEMTKLALDALLDQKQYTYDAQAEVFYNPRTNKPWSNADVLGRYWRKLLSTLPIPYRNFHQTRHTFISYMLLVGNKPEVLYKMVGHKNTEMIYRIYGKFIAGEKTGKLLIE